MAESSRKREPRWKREKRLEAEKAKGRTLLPHLVQNSPGYDFAALELESQVFFARFPKNARAELLESAVTRLVQGIYDEHPERARQLLRQRIFSTAQPTLLDQAMVKVGARKLTPILDLNEGHAEASAPFDRMPRLPSQAPPTEAHPLEGSPIPGSAIESLSFCEVFTKSPPLSVLGYPNLPEGIGLPALPVESAPHAWMEHLLQLTRKRAHHSLLHQSDRPISAVLLSSEGRLLSWAHNRSSTNPTLHAELSLLLDWARTHSSPLPQGALLLCSLKPCKMCAAAIVQIASNQNLKVYYFLDDPGPLAKNTALDGNLNFYTQNMCHP